MKKCGVLCTIAYILLLIGGLNWGLVGLGMLIGSELNVVNMLLGQWPVVEAIVYLLVGLAALKYLYFMTIGKGKECSGDDPC